MDCEQQPTVEDAHYLVYADDEYGDTILILNSGAAE